MNSNPTFIIWLFFCSCSLMPVLLVVVTWGSLMRFAKRRPTLQHDVSNGNGQISHIWYLDIEERSHPELKDVEEQ